MIVLCLHNIGAVVHYCLVNVSLWWFFHVVALFCKVLFPVRARQWEKQKKNKYFHLAALIIGQLHVVTHYHFFSIYTHGSNRYLTAIASRGCNVGHRRLCY